MPKLPEWLIIAVGLIWSAAPWVFAVMAWAKWARTRATRSDPAFLFGQILATVSCSALIPFYIPNTTRWEQLRIDVLEVGVLVSIVAAFVGLFILPFGRNRAKWLPFVSCLMNGGFVVMFFLSLD